MLKLCVEFLDQIMVRFYNIMLYVDNKCDEIRVETVHSQSETCKDSC